MQSLLLFLCQSLVLLLSVLYILVLKLHEGLGIMRSCGLELETESHSSAHIKAATRRISQAFAKATGSFSCMAYEGRNLLGCMLGVYEGTICHPARMFPPDP